MNENTVISEAAKRLKQLRQHATICEGMASAIGALTLFAVVGLFFALTRASDGVTPGDAAFPLIIGIALVGSFLWAMIRAVALSLHVRVDQSLIDGITQTPTPGSSAPATT